MLHRQLRDLLILRSTQDQDRNLWRSMKEPIEGLNSVTIGQKQIDQQRPYTVRSLLFSLSFLRESF